MKVCVSLLFRKSELTRRMNRFDEVETEIGGVFTISRKAIGDERGYLERLFCIAELNCWSNRNISQVNKTLTAKKGTVRGLHFQYQPYAEAKLISCLRGSVLDFALDLRDGSPTFGQIFTIELNASLHNAVLLPEGVAHGFQTLTDNVEMLYFHSQPYAAEFEAGINILDQSLGIKLPLSITVISERDRKFPLFQKLKGVVL